MTRAQLTTTTEIQIITEAAKKLAAANELTELSR